MDVVNPVGADHDAEVTGIYQTVSVLKITVKRNFNYTHTARYSKINFPFFRSCLSDINW